MIASASPSPGHIASNTSLAILPEIVPSAMRFSSAGERAPCTGASRCIDVGAVQRRGELAEMPVRGELRRPTPACDAWPRSSRAIARVRSRGSRRRPRGSANCAGEARALRLRQLRHRRAHALDPRLVDHQRQQVRIGKVAVVLRVFLGAHRARLVACRDRRGASPARPCRRPRSARSGAAPRTRSPARMKRKRVEVLDLAARAERRLARAAAPTRWRRSGTSLPACCRRRCRSSAPACAASSRRRPPRRAPRMSGSVTISSSGVPARLRSMPVMPWKSSCSDLPASSSRCARVRRTVFSPSRDDDRRACRPARPAARTG